VPNWETQIFTVTLYQTYACKKAATAVAGWRKKEGNICIFFWWCRLKERVENLCGACSCAKKLVLKTSVVCLAGRKNPSQWLKRCTECLYKVRIQSLIYCDSIDLFPSGGGTI
jgi:hypothetical protein